MTVAGGPAAAFAQTSEMRLRPRSDRRSRAEPHPEARSLPLPADPELQDGPQGQLLAPHTLCPTLRPEWAPKDRWPLPEPTLLSLLQGRRAQEGRRAEATASSPGGERPSRGEADEGSLVSPRGSCEHLPFP